ncbi:MAG TPA: hypothetical protein VKE74_18155 [Gemmataceae bacterium]|nr:hypothetical protein [Gemmataceae bacterium]
MSDRTARFAVFFALFCSGCLAKQAARDGVGSRQAILDLYTDQVMDNLIRARCGRPFVQLAYRDITVQDSDQLTGAVQDSYLAQTDRTSNAVSVVTGVVRRFSNSLQLSGGARRDRTISFKADPITDKNDIYEYYLAFALDPGLFVESDTPPPCPVHILKQCGKKYYWVPCEAGGVFLQLCLKTTFMRGPEKVAGPDYFEAVVKDVVVEKREQGVIYGYVIFDRAVKNDKGYMLATLNDGRQVRIRLTPLTKPVTGVGTVTEIGTDVTAFEVEWNSEKLKFTEENLRNAKAKIFRQNYFPPPPPVSPDLQRLNDNLDQIRLNTLNQSLGRP